ncbi:glycine-rich domain-containing protein [Streptoverticillium reticulum]|uniref:glycine-rich domain-containing protein n=1 Tax=Streptoverticillium reticulum TaxID=1433415 RepID=UPI0039BEE739
MTTVQERPAIDAGTLVNEQLRETIAADVRGKFEHITQDTALRGVSQMLAFVAASAASEDPLSPSPLVDDFWHAFVLRTKAYADFCQGTFGKFVHHQPGFLDRDEHGGGKALRARTVEAIQAAGYAVDLEFWPELDIADCSQCHANCHNSPKHNTAPTG